MVNCEFPDLCLIHNIYLFERFPDCVWVGEVARVPQPLQGTPDDLPVRALEVSLVGRLSRLGGDRRQVLQHPQQLQRREVCTICTVYTVQPVC